MEIIGYSERGVVSSLFYEIFYSPSPEQLLAGLTASAHFPFAPRAAAVIDQAAVLLEQSLSDFGDTDAILLLEVTGGPMAVFVDAKVKPSPGGIWRIEDEYQEFTEGTYAGAGPSNLFSQLYHKVRFVNGLRRGGLEALQQGLFFPADSTRRTRTIGDNPVVIDAVKLIKLYVKEARFIMLVPDQPDRMASFFAHTLCNASPAGYAEWDMTNFGYLCWTDVERFCRERGLNRTLKVLYFNRGRIF